MGAKKEFVIYTSDAEGGKMYFTGVKWGFPGYFNQLSGAHYFSDLSEAENILYWLDDELEVSQKHFIEEV